MIEAILKNKIPKDVVHREDVLTSEIFGLIQYLPITVFWKDALKVAVNTLGTSLENFLLENGHSLSLWTHTEYCFWVHTPWGEPDLIIKFNESDNEEKFLLAVEIKKESLKHGSGDNDQLIRYLRYLEFKKVNPPVLLYITPRDSTREILDSIKVEGKWGKNIFQLSWQSIYTILSEKSDLSEPFLSLKEKAIKLLQYQKYLPFSGFKHSIDHEKLINGFYFPTINRLNLFNNIKPVSVLGGFYGRKE